MSNGIHLASCYLPNNPFVRSFFDQLATRLAAKNDRLVLLPTYEPHTGGPEHIRLPYTLDGFRRMSSKNNLGDTGIVPAALLDLEDAWNRRTTRSGDAEAALGACASFYARLLDKVEPDTICVWNPTVPQGRILQTAAVARGIPCFGIERGLYPETIMIESREVSALSDLVTNPTIRSVLASGTPSGERLAEISAYYSQRNFARYPAEIQCSADDFRSLIGVPSDAKLVVLMLSAAAANWLPQSLAGMRFASPHFGDAGSAIRALRGALPSDAWLVVQEHPIDRGRLNVAGADRLRMVTGAHLSTLLAAGDALAFLGATTVQHEALLSGKPIILLSRSQLSGNGMAYEYAGSGLEEVVRGALMQGVTRDQADAVARYVPFLFEHVLYGLEGSPARQRPADLAVHLNQLSSVSRTSSDNRLQRWLAAVECDLSAVEI